MLRLTKKLKKLRQSNDTARHKRLRDKRRANDQCVKCGKARGDSPFKGFCRFHGIENRILQRAKDRKRGHVINAAGWKRKGKGRPPIDIPVKSLEELEDLKGRL